MLEFLFMLDLLAGGIPTPIADSKSKLVFIDFSLFTRSFPFSFCGENRKQFVVLFFFRSVGGLQDLCTQDPIGHYGTSLNDNPLFSKQNCLRRGPRQDK